jgi:Flp pilus assembly protein TadG
MRAPSSQLRRVRRRFARSECGAAAVEFALVAPVLLMLVFGIVDFGRAMWTYNVLTAALREGARAGAVSGLSGSNPDNTVARGYAAGYLKRALAVDSATQYGRLDATYAAGTGLLTVSMPNGYPFSAITPGFSRITATTLRPKDAVFRWELATSP